MHKNVGSILYIDVKYNAYIFRQRCLHFFLQYGGGGAPGLRSTCSHQNNPCACAQLTRAPSACSREARGRIRFVPSGPAPPDPEPRSLRSSSEKWAAKSSNERKKLAQIRYQVTCYGIKLESGDLPRFFMIDEIDHARLEKKSRQTVCVREFVRTQWF